LHWDKLQEYPPGLNQLCVISIARRDEPSWKCSRSLKLILFSTRQNRAHRLARHTVVSCVGPTLVSIENTTSSGSHLQIGIEFQSWGSLPRPSASWPSLEPLRPFRRPRLATFYPHDAGTPHPLRHCPGPSP
jgi:hypothetical protein